MCKRLVLLATLVAVLAAAPASALDFQAKQWYGQGILALPTGNFGDFANVGIGAGIGLYVPHSPELSFRGEFSYIYFTTDDFSSAAGTADVSASLIPINALGQYNLSNSDIYLLGGIGLAIAKLSVDFNSTFISGTGSDSSTELGIILGAGTKLKPNLSLEGRLNFISDANTVSANLGWWF